MSEPHVCDCSDCSPVSYEDRCKFEKERDQARADVLKLRDFLVSEFEDAEHDKNQDPVTLIVDVHADGCSLCRWNQLNTDTFDYEQYR